MCIAIWSDAALPLKTQRLMNSAWSTWSACIHYSHHIDLPLTVHDGVAQALGRLRSWCKPTWQQQQLMWQPAEGSLIKDVHSVRARVTGWGVPRVMAGALCCGAGLAWTGLGLRTV